MNTRLTIPLLVWIIASTLEGQEPANHVCKSSEAFDLRFVSVDASAFDSLTVLRFDSLETARGSTSHVDTALIWTTRSASHFRRRWVVRLGASQSDRFVAYHDRIYWRRVDTLSESVRLRFGALQTSAPCVTKRQMNRFYHAPPHHLTTAEIVRAHVEPSYVTLPFLMFGLPKDVHTNLEDVNARPQALPLLYEGSIAPAFLFQRRQQPWLISISPKVVIRQFYRGSQPVPPPSYMPRATLYYWGPGVPALGRWAYSYPYAWLMFSHHSNGQEGNPVDPATGEPNYQTGNFSANFVEVGYAETNGGPGVGSATLEMAASYQPDAWSDPAQHLYGRARLRTALDIFIPAIIGVEGYTSIRVELTWMGGPMDPAIYGSWEKRLNVSSTFKWKPVNTNDFALFANAYQGQDYYNIRYDRRIRVFRFGLIANPLHFLFEVPGT